MKITAVCGSPREGSTLSMIENILHLIKAHDENIETELIMVARRNIRHCEGCCDCEEDGKCGIRDEMEEINKIIAESDALIFGSPTYFDNVTGMMKDFIDRTNPLLKDSILKGKAVAVVAVGSFNVLSVNKAVENLRSFCATHNMYEVGYLGALNSSLGNGVVLNEMVKIAKELVNALKKKR
ncbi:MAG: flavodoxin family protein [Nanoarchaeota archaeon]|nr:flavodoxin family protein [Nanoarchaeota archaeon]